MWQLSYIIFNPAKLIIYYYCRYGIIANADGCLDSNISLLYLTWSQEKGPLPIKSSYYNGAFNMRPWGQPSQYSILAFKICLLRPLTDLIKPPSNFGVAAAPNNQILRTCEASPGFARPQNQTEFLLNLISRCWRCLWSQVNEQMESLHRGADPIGNPPCRHPFSTAFLLYIAVFT